MTNVSKIVVGVDGSPASVAALHWAAQQAALTGATLEAVTTWVYPTQYGNALLFDDDFDWALAAQMTQEAAITEAGLATGVSCSQTVTEGHPAQVLVQASVDADLLVVGSRGHGGFAGLLLGSVSEHVIAHADCPVLVIRQPLETPAVSSGKAIIPDAVLA